jgi:DNA-binding response OmpR family regulator
VSAETVLVVEDDPTLLRVLKDNLEQAEYVVHTAVDGEQGVRAVRQLKPDLVILDIMLPEINGYEVCRLVRRDGLTMPIIMLTAKGQESDIILGLNLGADDYVTKPFSIRELMARVDAFLRRRRLAETAVHRFGDCSLDLESHRCTRDGHEVPLTPKEFAVLAFLARRAGRAVTRDQVLDAVWGDHIFVTARSVDRCVTTLRSKVEADPHRPRFIQTVREVGYRFEPGGREEGLDEGP